MSVFLAIDLDAPVRDQLTHLIETHRATLEAKWLRSDKLHLTLVFLGNATADQVAAFQPKIEALVAGRAPFSLQLRGAGTFVTARAPAVLWLDVQGDLDALRALQHDAVASIGTSEERAYVPHLTLARAKAPDAFEPLRRELADFESARVEVRHVTLYESTHHDYRALSRHDFTP